MRDENTQKIVLTAMITALIVVGTMFFKIPIPFAHGYVHLGDAFIFIGVLVLGIKYGTLAAAIGSVLGDVLGGAAEWAPWTLGVKGIMALILGAFAAAAFRQTEKNARNGEKTAAVAGVPLLAVFGMAVSGLWMCFGYYVAEVVMYGNSLAPIAGIPWNIGQFAVGMAIALLIAAALEKTPARKYFLHRAG